MISGTNGSRTRKLNELLVLDLVRRKGAISRSLLAERLSLEFQTVSTICNRLVEEGLLVEAGPVSSRGRQARSIIVNPMAAFSLGVEVTRSQATVVAIAFDGSVLGRETLSETEDAQGVINAVARKGHQLIDDLSLDRSLIAGFGLSVPGPINKNHGSILNPPNFERWHNFEVRTALEQASGLPVWMENTATSAALGEQWVGIGRTTDDFMFFYIGSGVGAGIILQGRRISGTAGNAGEFAHMTTDPNGPLCSCGRRGCLVQYATPKGLLHLMQRAHAEEKNRHPACDDPLPLNISDVLAHNAPQWLVDTVDDAFTKVGETIAKVTMVLDPERIVFGGPLIELFGNFLVEATRSALERQPAMGRTSPKVSVSSMGGDAGPIGAASLPFHGIYSPWDRALSGGL